ncbi:MAG: MFS transporter [Rhizomicrobium sp.]
MAESEVAAGSAGTRLPRGRLTILLYCGAVIVALNFVNPSVGLFVVPLSFLLKNKLHLSATELATFTLWAGIPGYLSFAFGLARDFWSPFGLGDRGYFLLFGALSALVFLVFAFVPMSETSIFLVAMLTAIAFLFMWSAWNGLGSTLGQRHAMSGQISALWNFGGTVAIAAALFLGGRLSEWLEPMSASAAALRLYLIAAAILALVAGLGAWKPAAVFDSLPPISARDFTADIKRLFRHWPIYPALIAWLLWNFSPGTLTVLQYYMSDVLHASDAQWGEYNAVYFAASIPAYVLFGFLSPRLSLRVLLWGGAVLGVTQMLPLLLVHSATGVLVAAIPIGLTGGIATAAYMDLLIRSCPKGLEGTMMMACWSMYTVAVNFGNLWGTDLYDRHGGFTACVIATTIVYALILPVIAFVPRHLIATADGTAPA